MMKAEEKQREEERKAGEKRKREEAPRRQEEEEATRIAQKREQEELRRAQQQRTEVGRSGVVAGLSSPQVTRRADDLHGLGFGQVRTGSVLSRKISLLTRAGSLEPEIDFTESPAPKRRTVRFAGLDSPSPPTTSCPIPLIPSHLPHLQGEIDHQQVDAHLHHTLSEKSAYNKEIRQICLLVKPLAKMTNYFLFLALWKAMDPMDTNTFVIHASHGFPQSVSYFI